jgi:hypothetical protein
MSINPSELYSLETIDFNSVNPEIYRNEDKLQNYFWSPNPKLLNKLVLFLDMAGIKDEIIDVGCGLGSARFPKANYILGKDVEDKPDNLIFIDLDLDFDKFIQRDKYFNFVYCRHVLEDIQNPQNAFAEITRIGKQGYIETPSPLIEITRGADKGILCGYPHHRYIVWSDIETNTLFFLPKYPLIENLNIPDEMTKKIHYMLNNYSVYWNNYYIWNEYIKPNIVVYRNEINFSILKDYANLITTAIYKSMEYTNVFIQRMKNY